MSKLPSRGAAWSVLLPLCLAAVLTCCRSERASVPTPTLPQGVDEAAGDLLDLAFEAVSKFPIDPHIKNRSRAQQRVVEASLAVGELERARRQIGRIDNWRRGLGYAQLAYEHARRGQDAAAREALDLAVEFLAHGSDPEVEQKWRIDRVRSWIASTWLALGEQEEWEGYSSDLSPSEVQRASIEEARQLDPEQLDSYLDAYDGVLERGENEPVLAVLGACLVFLERFYPHPERRAAVLERIDGGARKTAREAYLQVLLEVARVAAGQEDPETARSYLQRAEQLMSQARWNPVDSAPLRAAIGRGWAQLGDEERALLQLEAGSAEFDAVEEEVVDVFRAEPLRALAGGFQQAGAADRAGQLYERAVEAGALNVNSRPRANDLADTACSMVLNGFRPADSLRARMSEISDGLGDPW